MGSFAIDYVYGDVWARPQLPRQDRCLAVVAFMVAFSLPDDLRVYLNAALNLGFSPSEMDDAMLQAASYGGIPFALAGMRALNDVVRQRSGQTELPARDGAEPKGTAERLAAAAATMLRPRKQVSKDTSAEDDRSRSEENTRRELRGQGSVGTLGMLFSYGEGLATQTAVRALPAALQRGPADRTGGACRMCWQAIFAGPWPWACRGDR